MALCLDEIVARLGWAVSGDGSISVTRIAPIEVAGVGDITFIANPKYQSKLAMTQASAVIIAPPLAGICTVAAIIHPEPYLYFARLAQWLNPPETVEPGIHPSATVLSALPRNVSVAAGAFIGENVVMGEGAIVGANAVVGNNSKLGAQTRLFPNATLYHGSVVGERCIIHSGVVIGADGFGFAREKTGAWVKIPQTGGVVIGNDVEVGANTTIDRGALADTVIEDGVKIDNQIQIGHNVRIGAHTVIAGCACVAGSTIIGKRCTIGGAAMIAGHLKIADDVTVSGGTVIAKNLSAVGVYTSNVPSMEHGVWLKNFAHLRHLDKMTDKIRALEARLNDLENKK